MTMPPRGDTPDSPSASPSSGVRRARGWTKRRVLASALLVIAALLLANTAVVSRQSGSGPKGVHVRQDGPRDAPALVLIHGLGGSTRWWDQVVPTLAQTHRVIRLDLLGHGESAKPSGDGYSIPDQARRIGETLDQLGVRHAVVVGHSTGGSVATALAELHPDLVTALALIDSGPRLDAFISDGFVGNLLFVPVIGQLLWRLRTDSILRKGLDTAFSRPGYQIPRQLVDDVRATTYHALTATSQASDTYLEQSPLPDRLARLGKPLLVIFGQDDRRWHSSSAAHYRTVPGVRIELLPAVGHSPMLETPPRTAALLLNFATSSR